MILLIRCRAQIIHTISIVVVASKIKIHIILSHQIKVAAAPAEVTEVMEEVATVEIIRTEDAENAEHAEHTEHAEIEPYISI